MAKKKLRTEKVIPQNTIEPGDIQESLALKEILDRSKKSLKEGKIEPLKDVMNDIRAKAKQLKAISKDVSGKTGNPVGDVKKLAGKYKGPKDLSCKHNEYLTEDRIPGEILLEEFLKPMTISRARLARETGIPRKVIAEIISGKRGINVQEAEALGKLFKTGPEFWINLWEVKLKTVQKKLGLKAKRLGITSEDDVLKSLEIPDAEAIESGGDIIIIPTSNRPRAYKKLLALAIKVIGNQELATLWLYETQFGLDGARSVDHMRTAKGAKEVESLLRRLRYGDCL